MLYPLYLEIYILPGGHWAIYIFLDTMESVERPKVGQVCLLEIDD